MSKFQFGDRVCYGGNINDVGVVIRIYAKENLMRVLWDDELRTQTLEKLDGGDIELIPHSDTARLDFVIKNRFIATFSDDFDDDYLIVKGQIPDPAKTFGRGFSPRQAIDNAMQQEQTK